MGVGILEYNDSEFARDLLALIPDLAPEFITLSELRVPAGVEYEVILDRLSFQDKYAREYLKMASERGCMVVNNPFSSQINNKPHEACACERLGIPYPKTIVLPLFDDEEKKEYLSPPDWGRINEEIAFPAILKPYDGYGWEHVYEVKSPREAENIYDTLKDKHILMLQEKIRFRDYYRAYCIGKNVLFVKYNPAPNDQGKYFHDDLAAIENLVDELTGWTVELNQAVGFDINSVEWCVTDEGRPYVIDAFNEVPDVRRSVLPDEEYDWVTKQTAQLLRQKHDQK